MTNDKSTIDSYKILFPAALTSLRLMIAPILIVLAQLSAPRLIFVLLVIIAFLSDWLDGVVARRLDVATPWLRRYDIVADVTFYLAVVCSVWLLEPQIILGYQFQFAVLLILEAVCQIIHLIRFRAVIATHAYLCKFWAIFLGLTSIAMLGFGTAGYLLQAAFIFGYIAYADVLLILLFSSRVPIDVISSYHVWLFEYRERVR